jgi:glycosyltransferase involved in cell wall biosynthesis
MSETKERNILLVYQDQSTFVKHDIELLSKYYSVSSYYIKVDRKPISFLWGHIKLSLFLLWNFRKYDIFYTWFGDYHAFTVGLIAKVLKKKHFIVVGGNDAVSIPIIQYGIFTKNNLRAKLVKKAYSMATALLPVDASLIKSENNYASNDNLVGLDNIMPGLKKKCITIHTGYDSEKWNCSSNTKKEQILSVAIIDSTRRAILKGFDLFIELAKALPEYQFIYIGMIEGSTSFEYKEISNLKVIEKVDQSALKQYYCESKVYAQLSMSEGLPNSLCEAMLCECIPIGSDVNGIPNCIGDSGFILHKKNSVEAISLVREAMNSNSDLGIKARERVISLYPESNREIELTKALNAIY